ncbi:MULTISPECIES: hypothetical protein [Halomonadaceae]|uniref:Uncharacterized protein n=1 Tax=Vreelandella titanicae TaxID=664683 RepID=A0AAP9T0F6_9GAMM|nr:MULTISPECIES: hypothetical protein [Halomonas]QKS24185.1 hypothetical protein FX987_01959 [Halomonas titanicae]CDG54570.1 conserved hypothetical protein [Halomonas sp. A3H3]SDI30233.1 hypothetical protein SAMN04487867_104179 [Halomonas titanicae]
MSNEPLLWRILTVAAVIEDEYGVTPTDLSTAVFFDVMTKDSPGVYQGDTAERERVKPGFGANEQINVAPYSTRTIRVPYAGSGTPGVPPSFWPLMLCSGHSETIDMTVDEEKVIYDPVSSNFSSISLLWWSDDDELQVLPGVRGTLTRTTDAKGMPYFEFNLTGLYVRPTTEAPPAGATRAPQAGEVPVNKQNSTFTFFGYAAPMQSWSFDMSGQVEHRNLPGYEGVHLTNRNAAGQVNIQKPRLADFNIYEKIESHNGTVVDTVTFSHNKTPGNIVDFEATRVQLSNYAETEVQGITHSTMDTRLLSAPEGDGDYRYVFR